MAHPKHRAQYSRQPNRISHRKSLWDALVVTFNSGKDKLQTFNLHVKANELKQGDKSLEVFWIALQGVWGEIDRIDPNHMKYKENIQTYTKIRPEQKLFQFLNGPDRKFEPIKREILRVDSLPTAEAAYAMVRKEAAHQIILGVTNETHGITTGLIVGETDGMGLSTTGFRRFDGQKNRATKILKMKTPLETLSEYITIPQPLTLQPKMYTDADWAGDKGNIRSTSGYFSLVGSNLITWRSKKQKAVSLSNAEAEFRCIAKGLAEALWIRKLVSEIGFPPRGSTQIMCDNKATIQISQNHVQHDRTKHGEVDRHFIKEKLEAGIIELSFVKSSDQLADILTKAV
nr:ribonuclease H-like domain-containing protein [Tanacetum cinerariifolium]